MKQWYESLFENYAHKYDQECFVQGTIGECNFIEDEINHDKSLKIIDIGGGTGRHARRARRPAARRGADARLRHGRPEAVGVDVPVQTSACDERRPAGPLRRQPPAGGAPLPRLYLQMTVARTAS